MASPSWHHAPVIFAHGVASGDPLTDRVVIWTRTSREGLVRWVVARNEALTDVVASGEARATAATDRTVQVDVEGLEPGTAYRYAFEAGGERSPIGRTRTLPTATDHLRFAMVSCAKFNAGFFNAYARIAAREDLDFVLHLGDYIYEVGNKPPPSQTPGADIGRPYVPDHECLTLDDYRARYAHYHADPDIQALHLAHPLIATVDCHEFADGAWREGSLEHREEAQGPWADRKAAAFGARWEWLPTRRPDPADPFRVWRSVPLGSLADLFLIDTRSHRDEPAQGDAMFAPGRTQLGPVQKAWLFDGLRTSSAPWRLLANSSIMSQAWSEALPEETRKVLGVVDFLLEDGSERDPDQWDGYPLERDEILRRVRQEGIEDLVVLSGDVHIGLVCELKRDPDDPTEEPVAVEFVTPSLTSQNVDDKMTWGYRTESPRIERTMLDALPHMRWVDLDSHGYVVVDVTPERVRAEWWQVATVLERTDEERLGAAWEVRRGSATPVAVETPGGTTRT